MGLFYVCTEVDKEDLDRLVLCSEEQGIVIEKVQGKDWDEARSKIPEGKYIHRQGHGFYREH